MQTQRVRGQSIYDSGRSDSRSDGDGHRRQNAPFWKLALAALVAQGHVLIEGRPRRGQDSGGPRFGPILRPQLFACADDARPVARRPDRHGRLGRALAQFSFSAGADLCADRPGRRTQSRDPRARRRACWRRWRSTWFRPMVCATLCPIRSSSSRPQNPIEQQGVFPLPEAQLDRFLHPVARRIPGPGG